MTVPDLQTLSVIPALAARYRAGDLSPAEYATRYLLLWQVARHGQRVGQRRSRFDDKPDGVAWLVELEALPSYARAARLIEILERYELRHVSVRITTALVGWLRGAWQIELCEKIPSVREVLRLQTGGARPVTVIGEYPRLLSPVLEKPDAFSFLCHDLAHAWQFFHDPVQCLAQQRFAQLLEQAIEHDVFAEYVVDPVFADKFDYLAADMNTHVFHSLQYLRAILLEFYLRAEGQDPRAQISPGARQRLEQCLRYFQELLDSPACQPSADNLRRRHAAG